jgi:CHAT domain
MLVSLLKDPESEPGDILVHVKVSSFDDAQAQPESIFSHSFKLTDVQEGRSIAEEIFDSKPPSRKLRNYGKRLFRALFSPDLSSAAQKSLQQVLPPRATNGRIQLDLNDKYGFIDHDLDAIPWEYAWTGKDYLTRQLIFTRVLKGEKRQIPPNLPLRIVVIAPDPTDSNEQGLKDLHLGDQCQNFINEYYNYNRKITLERVLPATTKKMNSLLMDKSDETATVFHFMGHCAGIEDGSRALVFEHHEHGKLDIVITKRLFNAPRKLWLAFLSACNTREVARDIAQSGVQYTIGSYCSLPDNIARKFESQFYYYLTHGQLVDEAIWKARLELTEIADFNDEKQRDYLVGAMVTLLIICHFIEQPYIITLINNNFQNRYSTLLHTGYMISRFYVTRVSPLSNLICFATTLTGSLLQETFLDVRKSLMI